MSITLRNATTYVLASAGSAVNTSSVRDVAMYAAVPVYAQSSVRDIAMYVATNTANISKLRDATVYTLSNTILGVGLRDVTEYTLTSTKAIPAFALDGPTTLLNAINREYMLTFTAGQLGFSAPTVRTGDLEFNTNITLTAKGSAPYSGSYPLRYNRFALSVGFGAQALNKPSGIGSTILASLAVINSTFGLTLTASDVSDGPISAGTPVTLTVASTSVLYIPGSTITLS